MKRRLRFGVDLRGRLCGAELAVRIWQGAVLPPTLFILLASAYPPAMRHRGPAAVLCELGLSALPRWLLLALSALYRRSGSEIAVTFVLLGSALALGLAAGPLLRGNRRRSVLSRRVFAVLLAADLLLRCLPLGFNRAFGFLPAAAGFLLRLGLLALTLLDLRAEKQAAAE